MYSLFGEEEIDALEKHSLTLNSHLFGVDPTKFKKSVKINELFKLTAISVNETNHPFVASFEGNQLPIYGTQFHPEKPFSVFAENSGINHSWESIRI